jgi:hypothetical protein
MLNKLFGKKKKDYFLEIEEKPETQQNEPEEVVSEEAKPEEATTATEVKSGKVEKRKAVAKSTKSDVKTVSSTSVSYEQPAWVKAIKNYSNTNENESNGSNAKPSYLMVDKPKPSRRPGPSLNEFKKMANNIKK